MSRFAKVNNTPKYTKTDINQPKHAKDLNMSLCIPSLVHTYSLCIEYMKNWFLSRFHPDTFKTVNIDGKHSFQDLRTLSESVKLKRPMPAVSIVPTIDWSFNNDNVDSHPYGLRVYTPMGRYKDSFFQDPCNNIYLGICLETIFMPFTFRVKVETRAQQIDFYSYMKTACRVGFSNGEDVDMDFHVPYYLMCQLAEDAGFCVRYDEDGNGKIMNIIPFLNYLNSHTPMPFLYKHRCINGRNEFFVRMTNMYVYIKCNDLSVDDGEQEGHLTNNYTIEFSCDVRFPAPKMYTYYSRNDHKLHRIYSASSFTGDINVSTFYAFKATDIPDCNTRRWPRLIETTYEDEEVIGNEGFDIDINGFFSDDIDDIIKEDISMMISPSIFLDFMLINDGHHLNYTVDWPNMIIHINEKVYSPYTHIAIYGDLGYINDKRTSKMEADTNRISDETYKPTKRIGDA